MRKPLLLIILVTIGFIQCAQQQPATQTKAAEPKVVAKVNPSEIVSIYYDDDLMREAKAAYEAKDPAFMSMFTPYQRSIESQFMNAQPVSVTDNIKHLPPTGDPRDYITPSPYWFPDPDTEDGLPYVRNDGVRNPWVSEFPGGTQGAVLYSCTDNMAFLYYITGEEKYAAKAAEFIRTWFLDPVKGMNPNIVFAQYVPGMQRIRGTGLLEGRRIVALSLNAAKMMESSTSWTDEDEAALQDWAAAYLYWMEYSTHGQEEHKGGNNHAMWYEVTRQAVALYTKEYDHLADIIMKYQYPRLSDQIAADSTMPHELARTLGLHYTTFTLTAVNQTAIIGRKVGITDVWSHIGPNGRGMMWAVDFISRYWQAPQTWPHMQIRPANEPNIPFILYQINKETNNQKYLDLAYELWDDDIANYGSVAGINQLLHYKFNK